MSYNIYLRDLQTGAIASVPRHFEGGTIAIDGTVTSTTVDSDFYVMSVDGNSF